MKPAMPTAARIWRAACLPALALAAGAAPTSARTVEYLTDLAAIRAAADDQGITGPFSDAPAPGPMPILLDTPQAADHQVIVASAYCQAYKIQNPVSILLQHLITAVDMPVGSETDAPAGPAITLHVRSGTTVLRCMGKSDLEAICKNRVRITADASFTRPDGTEARVPLTAQVERDGRVGGFCGNIARYTGIVTREAGIELIRQARAAAGA